MTLQEAKQHLVLKLEDSENEIKHYSAYRDESIAGVKEHMRGELRYHKGERRALIAALKLIDEVLSELPTTSDL
jgi:hypothetical protein